jgi:hypothetical protein
MPFLRFLFTGEGWFHNFSNPTSVWVAKMGNPPLLIALRAKKVDNPLKLTQFL